MPLVRDKLETGITDFITTDGAEGETGAGLDRCIGIIDSGKIVGGFAMVLKLDIGRPVQLAAPFHVLTRLQLATAQQ